MTSQKSGGNAMSIREMIQKHRGLANGAAIIMLLAAVMLIVINSRSGGIPQVKYAYYSDDDGQSYFRDDVNKLFPFDHDGKQAYRAFVFQTGAGKPFVGYLERINDKAMAKLVTLQSQPQTPGLVTQIDLARTAGLEARMPGSTEWLPESSAAFNRMVNALKGPDGSSAIVGVMP
jgi:hypothetical protein